MTLRTVNILLVDDDDLDIENVQRAFKKGGVVNPVFVARDGIEALEKLRSEEVPRERLLVLLDLNMPRMNGLEFLAELRKDVGLQRLPVVVLTTSNEDSDRVEAYGMNVAGYLLKPVTFNNFVELMQAMNRYWQLVEFP
jgi:CheY-like chemotaxis protein